MSITPVKDREGWYDVVVYDRVKVRGGRPQKRTERVQGQRNAERVETRLKAERDAGLVIADTETLSGYARRYLKSRRAEVSAQTLANYKRNVKRYIDRHPIGAMLLRDVDVSAVCTFYADLRERGSKGDPVGTVTIRGVHRVLSLILKRATVDGLLRVNPCTVAKVPKDTTLSDDLEDDEPGIDPELARELVAGLQGSAVYTAAALALATGLRRSELLGLLWQNVDFPAGELHVRGKLEQIGGQVERKPLKSKRSKRTVPFGPNVAEILRQQKAAVAASKLKLQARGVWVDSGHVFPTLNVSFTRDREMLPAGRMWSPDAFARVWTRAVREMNGRRLGEFVLAGGRVEDFEPLEAGPHALRHAYCTAQLAAGVRLEVVSRRMGHSSSAVTAKIYSHVTAEETRDGVDVVDGLL